jgi:chitinase
MLRLLFLLTALYTPFHSLFGQAKAKKYVIIGYTSGDVKKQNIEAEKLTHLNYAFAVPAANGELEKPSRQDSINLLTLNTLRIRNKDLKILISIGGWGGCKYFSDAALTDASRLKFANSAIAFMKKFKLDGVDIDWEYPAQIGDNNIFRPEDKQNYTLLLKTLREKLTIQAATDKRPANNPYLLTTATGVDTAFVNHTELGKAQQYLDYINIMTYDIYHGNDKVTGHHSNLYQSAKGNQSRNSSADGVKGHIVAGVPANKIVLGLPFYGRSWTGVKDQEQGLYQPATGKHDFISYDVLATSYINKNGFSRYWDEQAKAPYLWNPVSRTFITYADVESFTYKTEYVKSTGLAGVMFWEYGLDMQQKKLLNKLYQDLAK